MTSVWSEIESHGNAPQDCMLFPVEDQSVLAVTGPDSQKFMQGQFTCHLNEVSTNTYRPGACCNAKGRMVTSFNLIQVADGQYLMSMHHSLTDLTLNHLKKYMVFFKSQMQQSDYLVAGLSGVTAQSTLEQVFESAPSEDFGQVISKHSIIVKLPYDAGFQLFIPSEHALDLLNQLSKHSTLATNQQWNENLIEHGLGYVTQATSEVLIPQMLNLSQQGGISFNKGCYTGQEIVARMQYLGKLKRHMYRVSLEGSTPVMAGDPTYLEGKNSPIGEVVLACQESAQALIVVEDKTLSEIANNTLNIGTNKVLVKELLSLPYDVIEAQPE